MTLRARRWRLRVCTHERGGFRDLRGENVLIYWPHGFGDWVQLSYILPLLEPSNRYWITRFGDDNISVMDNHPFVKPAYLGINSIHRGDGEALGCRHFGLQYAEMDGSEREVWLPDSVFEICRKHHIGHMLWSSFPETAGRIAFPYQSKARNLIPYLVPEERRAAADLTAPLKNSLSFEVPAGVAAWVEARLRNLCGFGESRMCIIGRNGYTSVGKNWGHLWREDLAMDQRREGEECREFIRLMRRKDSRWMFLAIEDRLFAGDDTVRSAEQHVFSYAEVFREPATAPLPFGWIMKTLINLADLCVGVPAGPYHLAMAKPELPTVGVWMQHLPNWFDEPKEASIHVVSRNVADRGLDARPASSAPAGWEFRLIRTDQRNVTGTQVLAAVEQLI